MREFHPGRYVLEPGKTYTSRDGTTTYLVLAITRDTRTNMNPAYFVMPTRSSRYKVGGAFKWDPDSSLIAQYWTEDQHG